MVRFLHTADWQFGMKAREVAAKGGDVRGVRLETLRRVCELAESRKPDFVLLAGDVFEDNQVDNQLVHDVVRQLERFPCPVLVLPGNHDHAGPGSVYARQAFASRGDRVRLLLDHEPTVIGAAAILPAPIFQRWSTEDPTAPLRDLGPSDAIRVGAAHGSLMIEGKYKPDDFPIPLDAAAAARLDYLALGHWHSYYQHDARTVYSGTPEATKFGEKDSGTVAWVEIDGPGAQPRIERLQVGRLIWEQWPLDVEADPAGALARCRKAIAELPDPGRVLLRLVVAGRAPAEFRQALAEFGAWAQSRLYYFDLRTDKLEPELDVGSLRERCAGHPLLQGLLADLEDIDRPDVRRYLLEAAGDASASALAKDARYLLADLVQEVTA